MSNIVTTRISKAKIKDGQLHVELEDLAHDTEIKKTLRSLDGYHPDLQAAFDACIPHVREILEWPDHVYAGELTVTGVSWSYSESTGVSGAVMVCQAKLSTCNSPFCFNTPHLPFDQYCEDGEQPVMPADAIAVLVALRAEVTAYLGGKRAQGDMFSSVSQQLIEAEEIHESKVKAAAAAVGVNVITEADLKAFKATTGKRSRVKKEQVDA